MELPESKLQKDSYTGRRIAGQAKAGDTHGLLEGEQDQIITSNGFPLLTHAGSISHEQMEERTDELYIQFDQDRQKREAAEADQQDEADLKALETKIQRRPKK